MKKNLTFLIGLVSGCCALAADPAAACGEGQFNMGQGLRYQGYLAPRPATVLIYADDAGGADVAQREATMRGLEAAGHAVTVVSDNAALERALAERRYDVVIAKLDRVEALQGDAALEANASHFLPVVPKAERKDAALRARYKPLLPDGASLTQVLKAINQAVAAGTP